MDSGGSWNRNRGHRGGFRGGRGNFQRGDGRPWRGGPIKFRGNSNFRGRNEFGNQNYRNPNWRNGPRKETPGKRLSEVDIAVTEYVTKNEGFNGVIKSRYSDFQVSEINEAGEVAKLTDRNAPVAPVDYKEVDDDNLLLNRYNLELLPMETWDRINKLVVDKESSLDTVDIDVTGMDKSDRCNIHEGVKKAFGKMIVGSTVTVDDKKFIRFVKFRKGVRVDSRVKWVWGGEYCRFVLHKENCDTMDAAARLADRLSMKSSNIGYAGTKDRRAKTSQWFSVRRVEPARLLAAADQLRDVYIGNFTFSDTQLKLGMLKGNQFRIALRNVTAEDSVIDACCNALKENGFINYYGLQRFGTRIEVPTYEVGLKLLKGQYKEAIDHILEDREGPLQQAIQCYKSTKDAAAASKFIPRHARNHSEARLIMALSKDPRDFVGALEKIPRNSRLLYVHAYQSLAWNSAASARLARAGRSAARGDLVPAEPGVTVTGILEEEADSDTEETQNEDDAEQVAEKPSEEIPKPEVEKPKDKPKERNQKKSKVQVKVLTEEDIASGKYSISDIILPLPGYDVEYPPNMKDYYEELLAKDGLGLELKNRVKAYSMSGAYRHVLARPARLQWATARYSAPLADLILSDVDELNGKTLDGVLPDGKYKALLLTMTLPASSYATMALRELLKVNTSGDFQAAQNNYHKEDRKRTCSGAENENTSSDVEGAKKAKLDDASDTVVKDNNMDE